MVIAALGLAVASCKAIPLNDDPTVPRQMAHVSYPAVYEVAWNTPLVKLGLLEYRPTESASPAVDPETDALGGATLTDGCACQRF